MMRKLCYGGIAGFVVGSVVWLFSGLQSSYPGLLILITSSSGAIGSIAGTIALRHPPKHILNAQIRRKVLQQLERQCIEGNRLEDAALLQNLRLSMDTPKHTRRSNETSF